MVDTTHDDNWAWLDVYTKVRAKTGTTWAFRKRIARIEDMTYAQQRAHIARMLGQSPAVPMNYDDFKLVKRP